MRKIHLMVALVIVLGAVLGACGTTADDGHTDHEHGSNEAVTFDVNVIEIKGATDGIEPPEVDPASLSTGYKFKAPGEYDADNPEKWQVSSYFYSPGELVVNQGDEVTLRTFVLNGDVHATWLEAPDGSKIEGTEITMNRGRQYDVQFTADQVGYYTWTCGNHAPTMTAKILVIPN